MSHMLSTDIRSGHHPFYGLGAKMTDEQLAFIAAYEDGKILLFLDSIAGGGKTTMATALTKYLLDTYPSRYKTSKYIFAPVAEGKTGFRPGTQATKELAYLQPLKDAIVEIGEIPERSITQRDETGELLGTGWIEATSHTFMRGVNLPKQIIIIDEAQNFTRSELKKLLTRVHDSSLIFVIGHTGQCDLLDPRMSGFSPYVHHYLNHHLAWSGKFTHNFRGEIASHADTLEVAIL